MSVTASRDANGTQWTITAEKDVQSPGGQGFLGAGRIMLWWDRDTHARRAHEHLMIRQDNGDAPAGVVTLTLGMVYDLIQAAGLAVTAR